MTATDIRPFKISVPDSELAKLKAKLEAASFPPETELSNDWDAGAIQKDVRRLASRWKDGFDWRAAEAKLNRLPQFTTVIEVDGFGPLQIHFVHQKSKRSDAIPLLFCHGWPGGFWEANKVLPLLTADTEGQPSFHVVAPSLPNFGFSDGVSKPGFGGRQYAETVHKLMLRLGYDKYVTQGGDWGFRITRTLGLLYPDRVLASNVNHIVADPPSPSRHPWLWLLSLVTPLSAAERAGVQRNEWFRDAGFGYNLLHQTKPATIGYALEDSPVALLAWIYEKLHDWTDERHVWDDDEVLEWVSLYAFSRAGPAASVRIYYEDSPLVQARQGGAGWPEASRWNGAVPLGLSYFPRDLFVAPSLHGRTLGPVVFERRHDKGGHFASLEVPELLAGDLKDMFAFSSGGIGKEILKKLGK